MNFELTQTQTVMINHIRNFCKINLNPIVTKLDENSIYPIELFEKIAQNGWMGLPIPVEYGGSNYDYLTHIFALEEISSFCASTGFTISIHVGLVCMILNIFATTIQKNIYLTPLAKGEKLGAFALSEPKAGSDIMSITTTATLNNKSYYILNGIKTFVSNGPVADIFLVFAWTDQSNKKLGCFLIPKGTLGMQVGKAFNKMGLRSSQTSQVIFDKCKIPQSNIIGNPENGLFIAMTALSHGRIGIAAQCLGILKSALNASVKYSKKRIQFNKTIIQYEAISSMIADMATDLSAARFLTYYAAWLRDIGKSFSSEAAKAKLFASEAAMKHTIKAVQIHGGYGYMKGNKVERLMRDAKVTEIYEGTSEMQRLIISNNLIKAHS